MPRPILVALLLLVGAMAMPAAVFAHAAFERSNPSPGQVLSSSPTSVEIFTTQDLRRQTGANTVVVEDERGNRVTDGDARIDDANRRRISVALRPGLSNGRYVVKFETLSDEDGEEDHGSFAFYIGIQPTDTQRSQDAQLTLTSAGQSGHEDEGMSSVIPIIAGVVAVLALLVIGGSGWILLRNRSRQS